MRLLQQESPMPSSSRDFGAKRKLRPAVVTRVQLRLDGRPTEPNTRKERQQQVARATARWHAAYPSKAVPDVSTRPKGWPNCYKAVATAARSGAPAPLPKTAGSSHHPPAKHSSAGCSHPATTSGRSRSPNSTSGRSSSTGI